MEEKEDETMEKSGGNAAVHDIYYLYARADGSPCRGRKNTGVKGNKSDYTERGR